MRTHNDSHCSSRTEFTRRSAVGDSRVHVDSPIAFEKVDQGGILSPVCPYRSPFCAFFYCCILGLALTPLHSLLSFVFRIRTVPNRSDVCSILVYK